MPTLTERQQTGQASITLQGKNNRNVLRYRINDADDEIEAYNYMIANSPAVSGGLVKYTGRIVDQYSYRQWFGEVEYVDSDKKNETFRIPQATYLFNFETTTENTRVYFETDTTAYAPAGQQAPDLDGAINWDGVNIQGFDVPIGYLNFNVRYRLPMTSVTLAYMSELADLQYSVNNAAFYGAAIGEVMFMGASGAQGPEQDTEITYKFKYGRNRTNLTIGGITGINKNAHDYLWTLWDYDVDQKKKVPKARAAYVHKVRRLGDFTKLLIGTG